MIRMFKFIGEEVMKAKWMVLLLCGILVWGCDKSELEAQKKEIEALKSEDEKVRKGAIGALRQIGGPEAKEALATYYHPTTLERIFEDPVVMQVVGGILLFAMPIYIPPILL